VSFDEPIYTAETIVQGTLNLLEIIRLQHPHVRMYQASSCLPAGTKVLVKKSINRKRNGKIHKFNYNGALKNIEDIVVGDEVLSFNTTTSKKEYNIVEKTGDKIVNDMFELKFSNRNSLRLSGNHPVFVVNNG
jgi:hypothetical protein